MIKRGDVVWIEFPQIGESSVIRGRKPAIIVQNDIGNAHSTTTIVVPLTTSLKRMDMPTHVAITWGSLKPSLALCEQIQVVPIDENWKPITHLPEEIMSHLTIAMLSAISNSPCGGDIDD